MDSGRRYSFVKVFSATKSKARSSLGDRITEWIRANNNFRVIDVIVTQSSDRRYHCLSIVLFFVLRR